MTEAFTLTHEVWKKISAAGESGTVWISSLGEGFIFIDHTDAEGTDNIAEAATVNLKRDKSYTLEKLDPLLPITADNSSDVFYALYVDSRPVTPETAKIISDVL